MNLKSLSDDFLLSETKRYAREEQCVLTKLLHHIREVDRRRLFSKLGYESIIQYVEKELGYSNDEAWRRVSASRLLAEVPEIEEKINSGQLNLTTLGMAQALFQKEKRKGQVAFSLEKKKEVLKEIANKSTRQAAKVLWSHSTLPVPHFREQVRALNHELSEYNFAADQETQLDIERLKGLLAHSHPGMTLGDLVKMLCKLGLKEWDPTLKTAAPRLDSKAEKSRQVWRNAQRKCTNCGSYYALQEDHIYPKAKGGSDDSYNKRLLCRNCNQRAAIEHYGQIKMESFVKSPWVPYRPRPNLVTHGRQNPTDLALCRFLKSS